MVGHFITFEGGEGAGKTSALKGVADKLCKAGYQVLTTREPGGSVIAEKIRETILNPEHTEMDARTEALLYAAARRQHLVEIVQPALEQGKIVLCDRFLDSSLAYQGFARGLGIEEVYQVNHFAINQFMPQLTLFFDIEPSKGLRRIQANQEREQNRLDLENLSFHQSVYEGYQIIIKQAQQRIKVINADRPLAEVIEVAFQRVFNYIK
ncbi:thymidylate kinase [Amphibacillus marinus]|uniref:Thymidylate kinase n=1 Tax=Amphibacillus marinus TaxID=872970 RepID=A0A1H8PAX6_9BACI|nr:dTMP kinase [Amphibacillus marinus]SEO39075.1 thymidylate kinase [Amphibacillus marinus]